MKAPIPKPAHVRSGFSLIELMAVLVVVAIMTAMIVPEMRGTFDDALLRSSARKLISACQVASSRAIALHRPERLRVEPGSGRYYLESSFSPVGPADRPLENRVRAPVDGMIDARIALELGRGEDPEPTGPETRGAPDATFEPPPPNRDDVLTFFPDGTAEGPEVVLRDREGFRLALRLHPMTARMRVIELSRQ